MNTKHWKVVRALFTGALLAVAIGLALNSGGGYEAAPAKAKAPDFTLPDLAGTPTSLAQFRGHPVLLNFWATWCPPCRAELPDLQKIATEKPNCLQVVGISESGGTASEVEQFASERKLTYPILVDEGDVGSRYGVRTIPHSVLLDAEGNTLGTFDGPIRPEDVGRALAAANTAPSTC